MTGKLVTALALGAALLSANPAAAATCKKDADCKGGEVCQTGKCVKATAAAPAAAPASPASTSSTAAAGVTAPRIAWGGIGFYNVGISVDTPFGTVSGSSGAFGINAGALMNVAALSPDVPLAAWGNVGLVFPSGGTFFPITAGVAARYDKLPVTLLGGLGFTIMPHSGSGTTPLGLAIQTMGFLPIPQVHPNFSGNVQIAYHILSSGFSLFTLTFGGGWAF